SPPAPEGSGAVMRMRSGRGGVEGSMARGGAARGAARGRCAPRHPVVWLARVALPLSSAMQCTPRPVVVQPAHESHIPAAGPPVEVDFGEAPGPNARVQFVLFRGWREPGVTAIDVTPLLTRSGAVYTGQLGPAELREGRNRLLARIDV